MPAEVKQVSAALPACLPAYRAHLLSVAPRPFHLFWYLLVTPMRLQLPHLFEKSSAAESGGSLLEDGACARGRRGTCDTVCTLTLPVMIVAHDALADVSLRVCARPCFCASAPCKMTCVCDYGTSGEVLKVCPWSSQTLARMCSLWAAVPIVCERHGIKAFCPSLAQIPQECAFVGSRRCVAVCARVCRGAMCRHHWKCSLNLKRIHGQFTPSQLSASPLSLAAFRCMREKRN